MNTKCILLTGARAPIAVNISRTLTKAGHKVILTDSTPLVIAKWCKEVKRFYQTSAPNQMPERYIEELQKIIECENIELVIPLCEEVFFISRYKDKFNANIFVEEFSKMQLVHHKAKFCDWALEKGFYAPKSMLAKNKADILTFIEQSKKQCFILKQPYTRFSNSVRIVEKEDVLQNDTFPIVVQEFIEGREWCTYSVALKDGLTTVLYPSDIHYGQGTTIYYKQTSNKVLQDYVNQVIKLLGWTGQIAFDLIECAETGKFYFIECNPRATSGALFIKANAWFTSTKPLKEAYQMAPLMLGKILRKPSVEMLKNYRKASDIIGFSSGIRPFFAQFAVLAGWFLIARRLGCTMTEATTRDIEWNGESLP
ncbi:ATP-grasp domain-containing protein [Lederbergia lenta]|uniref:Predicted ATP-grasp enzyme n=1 Tax=Lederbergia lenta TaxID=1467 RepID=A0A2X4VNF5_LEDLE|nr:ATP-grasp domain-containing protein [Lederbergia lenta]MCM3112612.1 ATP-grasp domain-containing protein [Lederbergia lenta]MEC2323650.1 ATP-grasp domain-containing protein [Lederbergia lenta]SQI51719.1 Predicted ATP-grasp enzyme [Lederbergia lenta]